MKRIKHAPHSLIFSAFILIGIMLPAPDGFGQKRKRKKEVVAIPQHIQLTQIDETSQYRIVIPSAASSHELKASKVLQNYLLQISGAALPIISAVKSTSPYEILLGQNERLDELGIKIN